MSTQPQYDPDAELVQVFDTQQESEAMVVHGLLQSAGVESLISNREAPQDVLPGVGGVVIQVNPEHAETARRIIEEYRNTSMAEEIEEDDEDDDLGDAS